MNDEERKEKLERIRLLREQKKNQIDFDVEKALMSLIQLEYYLNQQIKNEDGNDDKIKDNTKLNDLNIQSDKLNDQEKIIDKNDKIINNFKKINKITDLISKFNQK